MDNEMQYDTAFGALAIKYGTTVGQIEADIDEAIDRAWEEGMTRELFNNRKPNRVEFMDKIAEIVRFNMGD